MIFNSLSAFVIDFIIYYTINSQNVFFTFVSGNTNCFLRRPKSNKSHVLCLLLVSVSIMHHPVRVFFTEVTHRLLIHFPHTINLTSVSHLHHSSDDLPGCAQNNEILFPLNTSKTAKNKSFQKKRKRKKSCGTGNISGSADQNLQMNSNPLWMIFLFRQRRNLEAAKLLIKRVGGDGAFVSLNAAEPS